MLSLLYLFLTAPWELIGLRFLEGVAVAAIQPAVSAYIADVTPEDHRSEAYGVLTATLNAGMLIGPIIGGVIGQHGGFTVAFGVNVAIEALAIVLVAGRLAEPRVHEAHRTNPEPVTWRALISFPLISAYVAFFSAQIVLGVLSGLWSIWIADLGGSYTFIGLTFTVFALPQIILGATAGRLGDRWGRAPLLLGTGLLVSVIYASYGFVTNLTAILVLGIVEGIFAVFQQPLAQGLLADASPTNARGRAQGIAGAAGGLGGAAAAFASLPLYHYSRPVPFVLAGVAMTAGSIVAALGAMTLGRRRRAIASPEVIRTVAH
jgi:MFS family permease